MKVIRGFQLQDSNPAIGAGATVDLLAGTAPLNIVPANQKLAITGIATYTGKDANAWGWLVWNFYANGGPIDPEAVYLFNQEDQLGMQMRTNLITAWADLYCSDSGMESFAQSGNRARQCLRLTTALAQPPKFVEEWHQKYFGLPTQQIEGLLKTTEQ